MRNSDDGRRLIVARGEGQSLMLHLADHKDIRLTVDQIWQREGRWWAGLIVEGSGIVFLPVGETRDGDIYHSERRAAVMPCGQ